MDLPPVLFNPFAVVSPPPAAQLPRTVDAGAADPDGESTSRGSSPESSWCAPPASRAMARFGANVLVFPAPDDYDADGLALHLQRATDLPVMACRHGAMVSVRAVGNGHRFAQEAERLPPALAWWQPPMTPYAAVEWAIGRADVQNRSEAEMAITIARSADAMSGAGSGALGRSA